MLLCITLCKIEQEEKEGDAYNTFNECNSCRNAINAKRSNTVTDVCKERYIFIGGAVER